MTKGRNVKSNQKTTTDAHERSKNFLSNAEVKELLQASKQSRYPI